MKKADRREAYRSAFLSYCSFSGELQRKYSHLLATILVDKTNGPVGSANPARPSCGNGYRKVIIAIISQIIDGTYHQSLTILHME